MDNINEIIEDFMVKMFLPYKSPEENIWIIDDVEQGLENIILNYNGNVITMTLTICDIPTENKKEFYRKFLEMNAVIVYGGYGIFENKIIFSHSIPIDGFTYEKFSYVYHTFTFYISQDLKKISNEINQLKK